MELINCVIVEDEVPAAILLEHHIRKVPFLNLLGNFRNLRAAQTILQQHTIDLIFLDINLPGQSGIYFAQNLTPTIPIIFTTAYTEFAAAAYELDAIDYIIKPISYERFVKAVNKYNAIQKMNSMIQLQESDKEALPFIFVKIDRKMIKFTLDAILYFEAQGNYLRIVTRNTQYRAYMTLSEMEDKLPEGIFCRIHRSFLINLRKVERFNSSTITITDIELPIGRRYTNNVHAQLALMKL